ncbi:MAG: exonuclease domain-containing protein [Selenomonadaceae bacterium]|nr:exonuclease domain-containing protein [Selenomonadaceae bacterium]
MFHVVIDLEMNPIKRSEKELRKHLTDEIIEFGAVKLDDDFKQIDNFQCYVKPEFGEITKHITKLTSITNEMVADKDTFINAFNDFMNWVGSKAVTIYSWSNSDINQLKSECKFKYPDFNIECLEQNWVDLQKEFDDKIGLHSSLALKHAVGAMNRNFEGTAHTALADAENTAAILTLMQDDEAFAETMKPVIDLLKPRELSSSIGDLCPELLNLKLD